MRILLCLAAWVFPGIAAAATFYVDTLNPAAADANSGSSAAPWKTLGKAAAAMVAGDTAVVMPGTYNETTSTGNAGAAGNRITFLAHGEVHTGGWNIHHPYTTVDGFMSGEAITVGNNGSFCEVLNLNLTNSWINFATLAQATGCVIRGNRLHDAISPEADFPQIQVFGTHHVVEANEIGPSRDIDAFRIFGSGHIIRGNHVHDITYSPGSAAHMDIFQTFGDNGWESHDSVIEGNRFINSEGQMFNTSNDGVAGIHDFIIRNNVFAHFTQNGNLGMPSMMFLNNTFYDVGMFNGVSSSAFNSAGAVFRNNIFIEIHGYNTWDYSANMFLKGTNTWTLEYNFFSTLNGGALTNFDNQLGGINGGAVNFINVAANDFSLQSPSAVIDHGATLGGFSEDAVGVSRPQGAAWDMGAYEYAALSDGGAARDAATMPDGDVAPTCQNTGLVCCAACAFAPVPSHDSDCIGQVCCTVCASAPAAAPEVCVGAENGILTPPMVVSHNAGASQSTYVATATANQGAVTFAFNVPQPGDYLLQVAVATPAPADAHNSFFVSVDGEAAQGVSQLTYDTAVATGYAWDTVRLRGPLGSEVLAQYDPKVWTLGRGPHAVALYGREVDTQLDRVALRRCPAAGCAAVVPLPCQGGTAVLDGGSGDLGTVPDATGPAPMPTAARTCGCASAQKRDDFSGLWALLAGFFTILALRPGRRAGRTVDAA